MRNALIAASILFLSPTCFGQDAFKGADCDEKPMSVEDLTKLAKSPDIKSTVDLLKALPPGTFQGYTLVTNSLSAQKGTGDTAVNAMWPRVLRSNKDGTITFSWTCNPKSETYNHVEMLYFEKGELKARSFNMNASASTPDGFDARVNRAPTTCISCHSTGVPIQGKLSMKHNWPEYFSWSDCKSKRGIQMYGGTDDNMGEGTFRSRTPSSSMKQPEGCSYNDDMSQHNQEMTDFKNFKEMQKDNPCYNLLPHPKDPTKQVNGLDYSHYPYAKQSQDKTADGKFDYSLRTNLRFTDAYSHLNAIRITELLKKSPDYEKMKYYLAMDAAGCSLSDVDKNNIKKFVPALSDPRTSFGSYGGNEDPETSANLIFNFGKSVGLHPADWSLEFNQQNRDYPEAQYRSAIASDGYADFQMADVVGGDLVKAVADSDPGIKAASQNAFADGVTQQFGKNFSCLDDLGEGLKKDAKGDNETLCQALKKKNDAHVKDCLKGTRCEANRLPALTNDVFAGLDELKAEVKAKDRAEFLASATRGKAIVQDPNGTAHCINCHSRTEADIKGMPADLLFMPSDKLSGEDQKLSTDLLKHRANEGFLKNVQEAIAKGSIMPEDKPGTLTPQEQNDVLNYLKKIVTDK